MPSFRVLSETQRDALIDYVIYLSIRGQTERKLIEAAYDIASESGTPSITLVNYWFDLMTINLLLRISRL